MGFSERKMAMRKLLLPFMLAGAITVGGASTATAAPSAIHLTVGSKAQLVSPTTLQIPVRVTCPVLLGAFVQVSIDQPDTGASAFGGTPVSCTGNPQTIVLTLGVSAGPAFTPGQAIANGVAFGGAQFDGDTRRIQIVL
jgi:hypothetical protein